MYVSLIMDCTNCFPKTIYWVIAELELVALHRTQSPALEEYPWAFFMGHRLCSLHDESEKSKEEK